MTALNLQHRRVGGTGDAAASLTELLGVLPQEVLLMLGHPSLNEDELGVLRTKYQSLQIYCYAQWGLRTWSTV